MCKWFREQLETTNIGEIAKLETKILNSENYREIIDTLYATNDQQEFTEDPKAQVTLSIWSYDWKAVQKVAADQCSMADDETLSTTSALRKLTQDVQQEPLLSKMW